MKNTYSIELEENMFAFLEEMAKKYQLPDTNKAVRCLINYARAEEDKQDTIFSQIRCFEC